MGSRDGGRRILGFAGLAVLTLVTLVLIAAVIAKTRDEAALAAKEAAGYTAPPLAAPSAPSTVPVVSVVGDELSTGSSADSGPKSEWPTLLASALHAEVKTVAAAGAGYVAKGAGGATLVTEASRVDPASTVVVLFGGGNDVSSSPLAVVTAATEAISTVQQTAPKARVVVVGPASAETAPSPALLAVRDSLQAAARIGKVEWQDPLAGNWLSSSSSLTTTSGVPNDAGEKSLESKLYGVLRNLVKT